MTQIFNKRYALLGNPIVGGMADVHKAVDTSTAQTTVVAVKIFRGQTGLDIDPIYKESFRREIQALRELKHANIVELYDSGVEEDTGRHFLVLPWLDYDLETWLDKHEVAGWDDFYDQIGRHILEGLAFAHERNYVHRDFKPKNILISEHGVPKITDFGISKLKSYLEPGVTLADFNSRPYTPPEYDDGSYSFSRDVFSFAVIAVKCLTKARLDSLGDVFEGIDSNDFDPPPEVSKVIERCLSIQPPDRYKNASALKTELDQIWQSRKPEWTEKRTVHVRLSTNALKALKEKIGLATDKEAIEYYIGDLNTTCGVKKKESTKNDANEIHFELYGEGLASHVAVDKRYSDHLVVINVSPMSFGRLGNIRESAWLPDKSYRFRSKNDEKNKKGKDDLFVFINEVDRHVAEIELLQKQREDDEIFGIWEKILLLKAETERTRNISIRYSSRSVRGSRVIFELNKPAPEDAIDQNRIIRLADGSRIRGIVESLSDTQLTMYIPDTGANALPDSGMIEFDSGAAEMAVSRQREALDILRFEKAVDPSLKKYLAKPSTVSEVDEHGDVNFVNENLDDAKKLAVRQALGAKNFLLVEGPPGTGKTTFITEIVLQQLQKDPASRILISSQTHVALDNCIEGLTNANPALNVIRVASPQTEKRVAPAVLSSLLRECVQQWKSDCLEKGKDFLTSWAEDRSIPQEKFQVGRLMKELIVGKKRLQYNEEARMYRNELIGSLEIDVVNTSRDARDEQIMELKTELSSILKDDRLTTKSIEDLQAQLLKMEADAGEFLNWTLEEIEEWNKENYAPKSEDEKKLFELLAIHSDWEEQFGRRDEFSVALLGSVSVVAGTCLGIMSVRGFQDLSFDLCIVDEASKATPTETLIPLVRSRKWVLVGDEKQLSPFQSPDLRRSDLLEKYQLRKEDFKQSLFSHLSQNLPKSCIASLNVQHRMVAPIGNLISRCFYDGEIINGETPVDINLKMVFPRPVMWFSTSKLANPFETKASQSFVNFAETSQISNLCKIINSIGKNVGKKYKIALIAGYIAQKNELERAINQELTRLDWIELECNTVDAFQGREADIVIYSVTRSNTTGNIGFLNELERINVALSRGKFYLGIVGDHRFCRTAGEANPLKTVIEYIEQNPDECQISYVT